MATTTRSTLFLGDLSIFCTENDLERLFSSCGLIEEIRLKRDPITGRNLSYGFVRFSETKEAEKALKELNGQVLLGRAIRIMWVSKTSTIDNIPAHTRESTVQIHVNYTAKKADFIVMEATLRDIFSVYGEVVDVTIKSKTIDDDIINSQSGYGFVHFANTTTGIHSALAALQALHNTTFDGVTYFCHLSRTFTDVVNNRSTVQRGTKPSLNVKTGPMRGNHSDGGQHCGSQQLHGNSNMHEPKHRHVEQHRDFRDRIPHHGYPHSHSAPPQQSLHHNVNYTDPHLFYVHNNVSPSLMNRAQTVPTTQSYAYSNPSVQQQPQQGHQLRSCVSLDSLSFAQYQPPPMISAPIHIQSLMTNHNMHLYSPQLPSAVMSSAVPVPLMQHSRVNYDAHNAAVDNRFYDTDTAQCMQQQPYLQQPQYQIQQEHQQQQQQLRSYDYAAQQIDIQRDFNQYHQSNNMAPLTQQQPAVGTQHPAMTYHSGNGLYYPYSQSHLNSNY